MELGSIIWIILIGGMFFLMMRGGGCCGGHSKKDGHGHEGGNRTDDRGTGTGRDHKKGCH